MTEENKPQDLGMDPPYAFLGWVPSGVGLSYVILCGVGGGLVSVQRWTGLVER